MNDDQNRNATVVVESGAGDTVGDLQEPLLAGGQLENRATTENVVDPAESSNAVVMEKDIVIHWPCSSSPPFRMNHNVFLTLILDVLYGISDGLWGGTVFCAYLLRVGNNRNGPVGKVEAVNGLAVLFSALPVGYLADKYGRSRVVAAGGGLILITATLHFLVMSWVGVDDLSDTKREESLILLGIIMAMWGVAGGVVSGPCQALFADSTPAGSRSKYYMWLFACYMLASCLGPLMSIVLFQTLGDDWDLYHLRTVVYAGLGLEFVNAVIMMFFDDTKALDESETADDNDDDSKSEDNAASEEEYRLLSDDTHAHSRTIDEYAGEETAALEATGTSVLPALAMSNADPTLEARRKFIPHILFASSLVFSIGSGMTIKFFPLFFKNEVGMSPTQVQIIYVIVPIAMVLCSGLGTKIAGAGFGRVQTTLFVCSLGVACLYVMVFFKDYMDANPYLLVPIYVVRTALINSPYPLQESILMDYCPKDQRARWKSLESVSQFGWCGSAAVGGWVSDHYDYQHTFFMTAVIQTVGVLILTLLLPLVPRTESDLSRG
jgi:MFS family permease